MSGWVRRTGNSDVMVVLDSPRGNESEESNSSVQTEVVVHEPIIETIAPVEKKKKEVEPITIIVEEVNETSEGLVNEETLEKDEIQVIQEEINPQEEKEINENESKEKVDIEETEESEKEEEKKETKEKKEFTQEVTNITVITPPQDPLKQKLENSFKRSKGVFEELITTEKQYIENLEVITDLFIRPLKQREILNKIQLSNLFSNVETLYQQVNCELLKRFESLELKLQKEEGNLESLLKNIGEIFCEFAPLFKLYAVYCSNQPNIHDRILQFKEENSKFDNFLKRTQKKRECRKLDLEAFLITPLQRLCKYPLLLRELERCAMDLVSYPELQTAIEHIGAIVTKVNERVRKIENLNKLISVNKDITISPNCSFDLLSDHNRIFLLDQEFLFDGEEAYGYLFNDVLLISRHSKTGEYQVDLIIYIHGCQVNSIEEKTDAKKNTIYPIEIVKSNKTAHRIIFSSKFKRKTWLKTLNVNIPLAPAAPNVEPISLGRKRGSLFSLSFNSKNTSQKNLRDLLASPKESSTQNRKSSNSNVKSILKQFESADPHAPKMKRGSLRGKPKSVDIEEYYKLKDAFDAAAKKLKEKEESLDSLKIEHKDALRSLEELQVLLTVVQEENKFLKKKIREMDENTTEDSQSEET